VQAFGNTPFGVNLSDSDTGRPTLTVAWAYDRIELYQFSRVRTGRVDWQICTKLIADGLGGGL
jgi:hypothetical protein